MKQLNAVLSQQAPKVLAILRIMVGLLFIQHGMQKLVGFPPPPMGMPMTELTVFAGMMELIGGLFVVLGLLTRPVAFLLSGFMAVGYFMVHAPQGFFPANNMGELAVLYCFVFLYFVFSGPGTWSLDNFFAQRKA